MNTDHHDSAFRSPARVAFALNRTRPAAAFCFACSLIMLLSSQFALAELQTKKGESVQDWCASQAERLAKEQSRATKPTDIQVTHYNRKLQRCFAVMESKQGRTISAVLVDAYANRTYATFFEIENLPTMKVCVTMPDTAEQKNCSSREEFDVFAQKYLERPLTAPAEAQTPAR